MLQNLSEEIQLCYRQAEECARQAEIVQDEVLRADYRRREQSWLRLARSRDFGERLNPFVNENQKRKSDLDRSIQRTIADGAVAEMARVEPPEAVKSGSNPRYLPNDLITIVDDDECARSGLMTLVESLGYRVAAFASAEDYLASDMRERTACLISDVYMPGMNGPDLQAHLVAEGRCPPIVFVTGRFEEHVRQRVTAAGALGYLTKPCNQGALLDCIGKVHHAAA